MANHDCYCALCSGPLGANWIRVRKPEDAADEDYDPEHVDTTDVEWLGEFRCLGLNADSKAFLSGRGRYSYYFQVDVDVRGEDPNEPSENERSFYCCYLDDFDDRVFPIHEVCHNILARSLYLNADANSTHTDKDVLYAVMSGLVNFSALNLNYGGLEGPEQFWDSVAGEEYVTWNPSEKPRNHEALQRMLSNPKLINPPPVLDLTPEIHHDPFTKLSYDILHLLTSYLSTTDTFSLLAASPHISTSTSHNPVFWKRLIRWDILSWFWEAEAFFRETEFAEGFDFKGFYLWANKKTTPKFGMKGELMGVANRRRIWGACMELGDAYIDESYRVDRED